MCEIQLRTHLSTNIGERRSKCLSTPFKLSFSSEKGSRQTQFLHFLKKRYAAARGTCGYMWRPLQRRSPYSIGFITTFWRPLLRHVETHCQSVAFGSNHSSSTFDFCNTSSVIRHGTEIASKKLTPVQKKRVINVALAAAGTTLFKSTALKDKLWPALRRPGGEGEGRGKPSPQGYRF